MSQFKDLFEYNQWANGIILEATDQLGAGLETPMPELGGSALALLDHLALTEAAFLALMTGQGRPPRENDRPYDDVRKGLRATDTGFIAAVPELETRLGEPFDVPWFGRQFTIEQGLLQVATHSVQHRAGIAAGIARAGGKIEELDYIMWLYAKR
ncbi:MAG: DinB family protein [bacterium]